jgi:hypothetical protein
MLRKSRVLLNAYDRSGWSLRAIDCRDDGLVAGRNAGNDYIDLIKAGLDDCGYINGTSLSPPVKVDTV